MTTYNIHINNLGEALNMVKLSHTYGFKGKITQNKYSIGSRNLVGMLIALPLDDATLETDKDLASAEIFKKNLAPQF